MGRKFEDLLSRLWLTLTQYRGFRLAFILALPVIFLGTAFTAARWSAEANHLLKPAAVPVTGQQTSPTQVIAFLATATTLPFSPTTPALAAQLAEPNCVQPAGWVPYMVSPADSLNRLSVTYGVTLTSLEQANCLDSTSVILPGQLIYVPNLIPGAPDLPPPTDTPTPVPFVLKLPAQYTVNLPSSNTNTNSNTNTGSSQPQPQPPSATAVPQPPPANTVAPVVSQPTVVKPAPADKVKAKKPPKEKKPPPPKHKADHPKKDN